MNEWYPNQYPNQNTGANQYPPQGVETNQYPAQNTGAGQYPNQYFGGAADQNGYYVPAGGQPYPYQQPPVKKKGKAGKIIGIVIGAFALLLVAVVIIAVVSTPSLDFGEVDGNTYKNESIGVKFTAPDDFTFKKADKSFLVENIGESYSADDIKTDDENDLPYIYMRDEDNKDTTIKNYYEAYGEYSDESTGVSSYIYFEYFDGNSEDSISDYSESSLIEFIGDYNDDMLKASEEQGFTSSKGDIKDKKIGSKTFRCQEFTYTTEIYGYEVKCVIEAGYYKSGDDAIAFEIVTTTSDAYSSTGYSIDDLLDCFSEID